MVRAIGLKTIALGLVSLAFVVAALIGFVAGRAPVELALTAMLFFGSCFLLAMTHALERKQALLGSRVAGLTSIRVLALLGFAGALLAFGIVWPDLATWLRVVFVALGIAGLIGTLLHSRLRMTVEITREGLVERTWRGTMMLEWDAICDVAVGEVYHNIALLIRVAEDDGRPRPPRILACRGDPERARAKRARAMAFSARWFGFHWFAMQSAIDRPIAELVDEIKRTLAQRAR